MQAAEALSVSSWPGARRAVMSWPTNGSPLEHSMVELDVRARGSVSSEPSPPKKRVALRRSLLWAATDRAASVGSSSRSTAHARCCCLALFTSVIVVGIVLRQLAKQRVWPCTVGCGRRRRCCPGRVQKSRIARPPCTPPLGLSGKHPNYTTLPSDESELRRAVGRRATEHSSGEVPPVRRLGHRSATIGRSS
eukprot:6028402-Prymnesium_polylepis.2